MNLRYLAREIRDAGFALLTYNRRQVEIDGIALTLAGMSKRMRYVLHRGHEISDAKLTASLLTADDRVLEIGAGSGFTSLYAITRAKPARYALVEANPDLTSTITENFALNKVPLPTLIHAAVGPHDGVASLRINREFWSSSILDRGNAVREEQVPQLAIPSILNRLDFAPNVLVLDVEGAEAALPIDHFLTFDKLLIEFHPKLTGQDVVTDMLQKLADHGYQHVSADGGMVALQRK